MADVGWDEFKLKREITDAHLRREAKVALDPWLSAWAEGLNILSPDLEYYLQQLNDILTMDQAKVDMVSLDQKQRAKDDVEDLRIYAGSLWRRQNMGRRLDRPNAEGVNRYGFAAMRIFYEMPLEEDEEGTHDVLDQVKSLVNRNAYFEERDEDDFTVKPVHPLTIRFWPLEEPTLVLEEAEISYIEMRDLRDDQGRWASMTEAGRAVFLGSPAPVQDANEQSGGRKKIRLVTRSMRDPESGRWTTAEFLFADGHIDQGGRVSECECPMTDGPYIIIPSGAELPLETTPHRRFRPRMQPLYVDYADNNFWRTMTAALGLKETREIYLNLSTIDERRADLMGEIFPTEGEGAQRRLVFPLARPGTGEVMMTPAKIEKVNPELSQALVLSIQANEEAIKKHAPNRFQVGNITPTEIAEGTGTAIINSMEASRVPPSNDLARIAHGIGQVIERCFSAIRYWDEGSPSGTLKRYPALVTGDEPNLRGSVPEAGTRVWVDAEKAARPYQLSVVIQNMTQAEQQVRELSAYQARAQQVIDDEQLIARLGGQSATKQFEDPGKQMRVLERAKARKALEPFKDQVMTQLLSSAAAALSGFNIPALGGIAPPMPSASPQPPAPPLLSQNRKPEGPPIEGPAAFSSAPPPPPAGRTAGPAITPAPFTHAAGSG